MQLLFPPSISKKEVLITTEKVLTENGFRIIDKDLERPWGGFLVIDELQSEKFLKELFPSEKVDLENKLSPKLLIVEPGKRLSWQYHLRRAEIWKVISGEVGIIRSETDIEGDIKKYKKGSIIKLKKGERHRLVGLDSWGIIAEVWQHADNNHPSNEKDIVRLQDDFGR